MPIWTYTANLRQNFGAEMRVVTVCCLMLLQDGCLAAGPHHLLACACNAKGDSPGYGNAEGVFM